MIFPLISLSHINKRFISIQDVRKKNFFCNNYCLVVPKSILKVFFLFRASAKKNPLIFNNYCLVVPKKYLHETNVPVDAAGRTDKNLWAELLCVRMQKNPNLEWNSAQIIS